MICPLLLFVTCCYFGNYTVEGEGRRKARSLRENKTFLSLPPSFHTEKQNNEIPSVLHITLVCVVLIPLPSLCLRIVLAMSSKAFHLFWVPVHFVRLVLNDFFSIIYDHGFIWIFLPLLQSNLVIYIFLESNLVFFCI